MGQDVILQRGCQPRRFAPIGNRRQVTNLPHSLFDILGRDSSLTMSEFRLGDVIDDHCIKCRRITNHSIVSIVTAKPAKVRCRTCYHDHDYRHEEAPPSKKDLKKAELFKEVLAAAVPDAVSEADPPIEADLPAEAEAEAEAEVSETPKKAKGRSKKA